MVVVLVDVVVDVVEVDVGGGVVGGAVVVGGCVVVGGGGSSSQQAHLDTSAE